MNIHLDSHKNFVDSRKFKNMEQNVRKSLEYAEDCVFNVGIFDLNKLEPNNNQHLRK